MSKPFERNARTVTLLTLVSRVTGLGRDAALSRVFGASALMSAFFFAFLIPNLFRRLFGEGALAAAFLPRYARLQQDDPAAARAFASITIAMLVAGLGAATLVIEFGLAIVFTTAEETNPTVAFLMIMLPYMPMVCLVAILGAMLQVHGRFGPTAAAPIVLNLCLIGTTIGLIPLFTEGGVGAEIFASRESQSTSQFNHLCLVGGSMLVAGVIQVIWSLAALRRVARQWWVGRAGQRGARDHFASMMRTAMPIILSLGVLQVNTFFDGIIASYTVTFGTTSLFGLTYPLDEGAMAIISFAQRLYQFPLGVFGIAVATAIFPLLSAQANDADAFNATLRRGVRLVIFIGLPASAGLMLVRHPLTQVIYQGGAFDPQEAARVGLVVLGYAPAIWAYSMTHVLTRAFYAYEDTTRPARIALSMVALNLALNCVLIWTPLREAGLAWSTSICATVQCIVLLRAFRFHRTGIIDSNVTTSWLRTIIGTAIMLACVLAVDQFFVAVDSWMAAFVRLIALTATGLAGFSVFALALRMPELRWALGRSL